MKAFAVIAALLALLPAIARAQTAEPSLVLQVGERSVSIARASLLTHPAARDVEIADPSYRRVMRYRAVPLAALLAGFPIPDGATLEGKATDGFVAQIPLAPALGSGSTGALIAIEPPAPAAWPDLPGKKASAGPFYLVWSGEKDQGIGPEQWPYMLASLSVVPPAAARWPQIAVAPDLPSTAPARAGQAVFVKHCFACHRINGGGEATVGPDLNLPMNPTEYFQPTALRRYLRDPAAVRAWPEQKMPAIDADQLSDVELEQLVAYLQHMTGRRAGR